MDSLPLSRADSLPLAARADSLPLAALLGAVDVVSPRRAAQAAALAAASPSSPSAAHGAAGVAPPSPSEHYRLVAAQRASDARSFIALVAGRFPRGTRVYDNFTRALAVYAKLSCGVELFAFVSRRRRDAQVGQGPRGQGRAREGGRRALRGQGE